MHGEQGKSQGKKDGLASVKVTFSLQFPNVPIVFVHLPRPMPSETNERSTASLRLDCGAVELQRHSPIPFLERTLLPR